MTMNVIILKHLRVLAPILLISVFFSGCVAEKKTTMTDKQLFESIRPGMSRVEVEKQLGKPAFEVGDEAHYGKPPTIESWQSPTSLSSIIIKYSAANEVESKEFYGDNNSNTLGPTH